MGGGGQACPEECTAEQAVGGPWASEWASGVPSVLESAVPSTWASQSMGLTTKKTKTGTAPLGLCLVFVTFLHQPGLSCH